MIDDPNITLRFYSSFEFLDQSRIINKRCPYIYLYIRSYIFIYIRVTRFIRNTYCYTFSFFPFFYFCNTNTRIFKRNSREGIIDLGERFNGTIRHGRNLFT